MKVVDPNPAQRQLVHKFIDWEIVKRRLQRFPAVGRTFPVERLRSCQENPPFYCHYMAWRLGTWNDDSLFARLDELLTGAEKLPSWCAKKKKSLLQSANFSDFWSLVWELQVAEYLCEIGSDVKWASSGPDLSALVESEKWYVECMTYHKSFGLMLFIEELLQQLDASIRVEYDLCLPFSLPKDSARSSFLDRTLSDFTNPAYIDSARATALNKHPFVLRPKDDKGLVVYMEGPDSLRYITGLVPQQIGDSQTYLKVALKEVIGNKQNANSLDKRRPNLLAVNLLLSADAQFAFTRARNLKISVPETQLGCSLDALAVATVGIDGRLERSRFMRIAPAVSESLALERLTYVA